MGLMVIWTLAGVVRVSLYLFNSHVTPNIYSKNYYYYYTFTLDSEKTCPHYFNTQSDAIVSAVLG